MKNCINKFVYGIKVFIITLPLCSTMISCDDFLERDYDSTLSKESVLGNETYSIGLQLETYNYGPRYNWSFNCIDNSMLACATDDAVSSYKGSDIVSMTNGAWSPTTTVDDQWGRTWAGIRKCNLFLSIADDSAIPNETLLDGDGNKLDTDHLLDRLKAETYFNKAFLYFDLVRRYKDVPMVDHVLEIDENLDLPRVSSDVIIDSVVVWCDRAATVLPDTYSDSFKGRATKGSAMMLKSRALLFAASPLYNPSNDVVKWVAAAKAAKDVIDYNNENNIYKLIKYNDIFFKPFNDEVIFAGMYSDRNDVERANFPSGYTLGEGRTNPTQNLVDAFEIKVAGKFVPFNRNDATHMAKMYSSDRDPRLAATVLCNGTSFAGRNVETYVGGQDGLNMRDGFTRTGYYLKKFIDPNVNLVNNTVRRTGWIHFRYAEALLNYAEAQANVSPDASVYDALNQVRKRSLGDAGVIAENSLSQSELIDKIHNERRVEFAFEEFRFWDVRRWGVANQIFNSSIYAMELPNASATPSNGGKVVEVYKMVFDDKMNFHPLSFESVRKAPTTGQTPSWR